MNVFIAFVLLAALAGAVLLMEPRGQHRGRRQSKREATCTGLTAAWCPIHGDCICPPDARDDFHCPLHSPLSHHAEQGEPQVPPDVMDRIDAAPWPDRSEWGQS